jgi:ribosomal protein S18 acetylase RimI-like enzyme
MDNTPVFESGLPDYSVHRLEPEDIPALQLLFNKCSDYTFIVEGESTSPTAAQETFQFVPPGRSPSDKFIFGLIDQHNKIVGLLEGMSHYPDDTTWWIGLLMLSPEVRGRGVGRKLLDGFSRYVQSRGGTIIMLGVVEANQRAYRFWQQMGFKLIRKTEPRQFGKKEQAVFVMQRAAVEEKAKSNGQTG